MTAQRYLLPIPIEQHNSGWVPLRLSKEDTRLWQGSTIRGERISEEDLGGLVRGARLGT